MQPIKNQLKQIQLENDIMIGLLDGRKETDLYYDILIKYKLTYFEYIQEIHKVLKKYNEIINSQNTAKSIIALNEFEENQKYIINYVKDYMEHAKQKIGRHLYSDEIVNLTLLISHSSSNILKIKTEGLLILNNKSLKDNINIVQDTFKDRFSEDDGDQPELYSIPSGLSIPKLPENKTVGTELGSTNRQQESDIIPTDDIFRNRSGHEIDNERTESIKESRSIVEISEQLQRSNDDAPQCLQSPEIHNSDQTLVESQQTRKKTTEKVF